MKIDKKLEKLLEQKKVKNKNILLNNFKSVLLKVLIFFFKFSIISKLDNSHLIILSNFSSKSSYLCFLTIAATPSSTPAIKPSSSKFRVFY